MAESKSNGAYRIYRKLRLEENDIRPRKRWTREDLTVAYETSVEDYVESMEGKNTKEKTKRYFKLFREFLRDEKNDERGVHIIAPDELNQLLAEFIRSVGRKDRKDYEPYT